MTSDAMPHMPCSKADSLFCAFTFVHSGCIYAAVEYTLGPNGRSVHRTSLFTLAATLARMVDQVCRAVLHVHRRHPGARIHLLGHSAGAHLAVRCIMNAPALITRRPWWLRQTCAGPSSARHCRRSWPVRRRGAVAGVMRAGVVGVSGLYDLAPVQQCYANANLHITDAEVADLSPLHHAHVLAACHPRCQV